ncbi:ATP-dependent nuclease [Pseudomonas sp. 14P_5.3_Bac1]|uniref:ATP-dependent nuclease n=1 Tax=Pseudomonas sp. 14P_5.3_Bac1 TaxID=2971622 RepID=UPI0021C901BF|nr:AAA family ATPase [Pseudomonas sp. 14P_5.3_Bac1]MCU1775778.1 AAA family ATPase [Pseudomonas sp. 14P_5.3_Bac1]
MRRWLLILLRRYRWRCRQVQVQEVGNAADTQEHQSACFGLMHISHIWFSGIRTLNSPQQSVPQDLSAQAHFDMLFETSPLETGQVNVLLGENGAGKSTILDMLRGLRYPEILASLPRENPPRQSNPSYGVKFSNGERWGYLFSSGAAEHPEEALRYASCIQLLLPPPQAHDGGWQYSSDQRRLARRKVNVSGQLYKNAPFSPFPRFFSCSCICYRASAQPEEAFDKAFVEALNSIRHHLLGLAVFPRAEERGQTLLNDVSFHLSEPGIIGVWLDDDHRMSNELQGHWLPSGWKTFAWIASWLRTCPEGAVCLIEEPETHLHPTLMRYLMETLIQIASERTQQLFISTHSAALINVAATEKLKIFQSHGTYIDCKPDLSEILDRMGYMASDILQANCVIWVEGPSDRTYLNHWISGLAPSLREGIHYSIMFYGGRLLSHLTADDDGEEGDDNLEDLISLIRLNRHSAILLDSDKSGVDKAINVTKQRIVNAFSHHPNRHVWVTKGREVENYLDPLRLEKIIKAVHPSAARTGGTSIWANRLLYKKQHAQKSKTANKVKVASAYVADHIPDYSPLDLRVQVELLCQFIKRWNSGMV